MVKKEKERRGQEERRSGIDRRRLNPLNYTGIEKRFNPDCRESNDRRKNKGNWIEYQSPLLKK
ncbi:hypothetical protein DO021_20295 [Desulfobacter hydrogenophilus]|uniref:Uncharacterized protein n=1 Tax=Desulfobacter hydrogenophilus TaxID=2291 RepID=A0A328F958_9BACT|nr:hypothetical protein [Desulfobacter hydrogenophilus]NDY74221.1 hypothetical protein [Desulfobacter hydrogenophilus]QBH14449.1 hypothetical protein EYB58_16870 [Desulfobacter hydrogenophilus]RAM00190.1 hypothetical protein DO021_20295 [Desulfobacter hydrogenophilus]